MFGLWQLVQVLKTGRRPMPGRGWPPDANACVDEHRGEERTGWDCVRGVGIVSTSPAGCGGAPTHPPPSEAAEHTNPLCTGGPVFP